MRRFRWMMDFDGGWFTWVTEEGDTLDPYLHSMSTIDLRAAFDALADRQ